MLFFELGSQPETKVHAEKHSANRLGLIRYPNPVTRAIKFDVLGIRVRQALLYFCNDLKTTSSTYKQVFWTPMVHTEVHHQQNIYTCVSGKQVLYTHIHRKITACLWKRLLLRQNLFSQRSVLDSPFPTTEKSANCLVWKQILPVWPQAELTQETFPLAQLQQMMGLGPRALYLVSV